jgi:hypothetical protein
VFYLLRISIKTPNSINHLYRLYKQLAIMWSLLQYSEVMENLLSFFSTSSMNTVLISFDDLLIIILFN